jgi:hypothetical protein
VRCGRSMGSIAERRSLQYGDGLGAVQRERSGSLPSPSLSRYALGGRIGRVRWAMWLGTLPSWGCRYGRRHVALQEEEKRQRNGLRGRAAAATCGGVMHWARLSSLTSENGLSENLGKLLHCGIKRPRRT